MPTTPSRARFARQAAEQFLAQTLHRKRSAVLLVAAPNAASLYLPADDRIHVVDLPAEIRPLGLKRNVCCEFSNSQWIAHWDDDDWRSDTYLETALALTEKPVFCRREAWFDDGTSAWLYRGSQTCGVGSTLLYRRGYWLEQQFPALQIGEDNVFIRDAVLAGVATLADLSSEFVARDHGANTSGRNRHCQLWHRHERTELPAAYLQFVSDIRRNDHRYSEP
jgi:hypothetical protein